MNIFSSNYNYDIVIVGGGISGLFSAYKLADTGLNILLIENTDRLGGRIETYSIGDVQYEAGAARFHNSHGKLLSLISDLNLEDKIIPLPKDINNILRNKSENYDYKTDNKLDMKELLLKALENKKFLKNDVLSNISFLQYLILLFDQETAMFIRDSFGYDSEFNDMNAKSALTMFKEDFFKDEDYYILKNGLSEIINKLEKILNDKNNVIIKKNCSLIDIKSQNKTITTGNGDIFYYDNLILAIPKNKLQQLNYFENNTILNSVKPIKLIRIYAKYPTNNLWFKNIKRTTTDNYLRHIIPIDYDNGIIMISYTDSMYAEMWKSYSSISDKFLIKALHKEIYNLFGIVPPKPEFISTHYWENGVHVWKTGYDMDELYPKILQPDIKQNIYIVGESFSKKQGWIEGAMDSVYDLLKIINIDGFKFVSDNNKKNLEGGKSEKNNKKYTIEEVINNKKWIIIDHDGKKSIYNISKWIPNHPGGNIIVEKGVKANSYYKDPPESDISPIDLFNQYHSKKIMNKYLLTENPFVKHIGYLM